MRGADFRSSVDLPGKQQPTSTRHLGRLTPVLHRPAEPSTFDVRPAAARPTAPPRRQHPLQPTPPRQNTPPDAASPHQTAPTGTSAPCPQRLPQNSTLLLSRLAATPNVVNKNTGGDNRMYLARKLQTISTKSEYHKVNRQFANYQYIISNCTVQAANTNPLSPIPLFISFLTNSIMFLLHLSWSSPSFAAEHYVLLTHVIYYLCQYK
ncbi:unnamed protein product [Schistosoma margrebowiei]|uniref:Uncharacterized protein n=1 Tax=Schistosoma margrebowiei TaxID=48269 RepID=A0AA85AKD3_9TREM|nr:unnamed protein product [Schistosoma margrebowiei]